MKTLYSTVVAVLLAVLLCACPAYADSETNDGVPITEGGWLENYDIDTADIDGSTFDGGVINSSTIGLTTPAAGSFTDLNLGAANLGISILTGFHAGNLTQTGNMTSINGNNPVVRNLKVYISTDPTADTDVSFRISFYETDAYTEDLLIWDHSFNLSYTETNGGVTATDTTDTVDTSAGLVKYDLIRFLGATVENQRLTATPTATGLTFTEAGQDHADDTGIVKVWEFKEVIQLYDADGTNEIHVKLEALAAFTASSSIYIIVEYQ